MPRSFVLLGCSQSSFSLQVELDIEELLVPTPSAVISFRGSFSSVHVVSGSLKSGVGLRPFYRPDGSKRLRSSVGAQCSLTTPGYEGKQTCCA